MTTFDQHTHESSGKFRMCACCMPSNECQDDIANGGEQGAQNGHIRKSAAGKTVCGYVTVERLSCKGR